MALCFSGEAFAENKVGANENEREEQTGPSKKEIAPETGETDPSGGTGEFSQVGQPAADSLRNDDENAFQKFNFIFYFLYKYKYDQDSRYGNGIAPLGLDAN
ncbi:MAG: hypothetical protein AAGA85_05240 [Bacteroidota bacterium]